MRPPVSRMFGHEVTVQAYSGPGAAGPVYAAPVTVRCRVNSGRRLARSPGQDEVSDQTTVYLPHSTVCPVGSRLTLPDGRTVTVVQAHPRSGGSLPTPAHLEVVAQ